MPTATALNAQVVLQDAEEVWAPRPATDSKPAREGKRKPLGRILLKGENVTALVPVKEA